MQIAQAIELGTSLKHVQLLCPCRRELLCEVLPAAALVLLPEDILKYMCASNSHGQAASERKGSLLRLPVFKHLQTFKFLGRPEAQAALKSCGLLVRMEKDEVMLLKCWDSRGPPPSVWPGFGCQNKG